MKGNIWKTIQLGLSCFLLSTLAMGDDGNRTPGTGGGEKIAAFIEQLGADGYQEREEAFEALKKIGEDARAALKKALDSGDPEIRWSASRLLGYLDGRKVEHREPAGREEKDRERRFPGPSWERLRKLLPEADGGFKGGFRPRLDEDFFHQDLGALFKELFGDDLPLRFRLFDEAPFQEMDRLMEALKQMEGGLKIEIDGSRAKYHVERRDENGSEEMSLDVAGDGSVKARVKRIDRQGDASEETYEADSLEGFKRAYPEMAGKFGLDGLVSGFPDLEPDREAPSLEPPPLKTRPQSPLTRQVERRKTLGVYLHPEGPSRALRAQIGLEEGRGVIIERVLPDTFAEKIGLKPLDVIISVRGKPAGSTLDIRKALADTEYGEEVAVEVIREGRRRVLSGKYTDLASMRF